MLWPHLFLTFVSLALFKAGHVFAAATSCLVTIAFFIRDLKHGARPFLSIIAIGVLLGGALFWLRAPLIHGSTAIATKSEAEVIGVSRKSIVVRGDSGQKLRLTGFKKGELPLKHARVAYSCEVQEIQESTFMVFERLSGVAAWCKIKDIKTIRAPYGWLTDFRKTTLNFLYKRFEAMDCAQTTLHDRRNPHTSCAPDDKTLIAAFLLGDTEDLAPQELDAFRDMGLMHLFAVSGLNIALLFAILYLPFRFAGVPTIGAALGYAVATAFLLLLDFPVPLLRAWLFMTIGLGMRLLDRRLPSWTLLFLTAIVVEVLFPLSTFSMSFILSFGITAAILIFYEPLYFCFAAKNKVADFFAQHVALTLAAGLPALLLGYPLFGSAQPLSLVYNLLLVPFSGLYLFASLLFMAFEPVKYVLFALDALYLKFAALHSTYVSSLLPAADRTMQTASLMFVAVLLVTLYILKMRGRLWSARRNLRFVVPVTALILIVPFFLASYPNMAIYAVPNKVWMYSEKKLMHSGAQLFSDGKPAEPKTCFPIREKFEIPRQAATPEEILMMGNRCFIFTGRMKPENWPPDLLKPCVALDVFQSKKMRTDAAEWDALFKLFGYQGKATVRKFFTWYADKPLTCAKSEKL